MDANTMGRLAALEFLIRGLLGSAYRSAGLTGDQIITENDAVMASLLEVSRDEGEFEDAAWAAALEAIRGHLDEAYRRALAD